MRTGRSRKSPSSAKCAHVLLELADRRRVEAVVEAAQHDVLAPGQIDVHAEAADRAARSALPRTRTRPIDRLVDAGERAQQRGLAGAVDADQAEAVAARQRES